MRAITELQPDTRYHRICLQSPLENQYQNVKHKLAAGDLLFVMDRLREESLLFDEVILDDLRFYGFLSHIREILGGPGAFLRSSAYKIFEYMQALIQDKDELAVYIIKNVPDLLFCLDDETKAKFGLWPQLVKEKKWAVLRKNKKYALLEKAGKEYREARRQLVIAGEYFRIFRHPGWEEILEFICDDDHRVILTYKELIGHGYYQLAFNQYKRIANCFKETAEEILNALLKTAGGEFLYEQKDENINRFLLEKGKTEVFVKNKEWHLLAVKGYDDLIDWEDYLKNFCSTSLEEKILGKKIVFIYAYKAGQASFLRRHRRYGLYLKLKWKNLLN